VKKIKRKSGYIWQAQIDVFLNLPHRIEWSTCFSKWL